MPVAPAHVCILGLGPTLDAYTDLVKRLGDRRRFCDEVWAINATAGLFQHDRVFHMDDMRVQVGRAALSPGGHIDGMLGWLRTHPGPVYTSVVYPEFPGAVAFPLFEVIDRFGAPYFNSTVAYAVAYALFIGVKKISLFGIDFSYAHSHAAEKGRGCVEYWLGIANAMKVDVCLPEQTPLMDSCVAADQRFYGYDAMDIALDPDGRFEMKPRAKAPDAAEIERRYDHSKPTVPAALLAADGIVPAAAKAGG